MCSKSDYAFHDHGTTRWPFGSTVFLSPVAIVPERHVEIAIPRFPFATIPELEAPRRVCINTIYSY